MGRNPCVTPYKMSRIWAVGQDAPVMSSIKEFFPPWFYQTSYKTISKILRPQLYRNECMVMRMNNNIIKSLSPGMRCDILIKNDFCPKLQQIHNYWCIGYHFTQTPVLNSASLTSFNRLELRKVKQMSTQSCDKFTISGALLTTSHKHLYWTRRV